jgi:hypothetical protein
MKVIISLQELYAAVEVIAKEHGETYISVYCELSSYGGMKLKGYINGFNWQTGGTIAEVCNGLRAQKNPIENLVSPVNDVEIEAEIPEENPSETLP